MNYGTKQVPYRNIGFGIEGFSIVALEYRAHVVVIRPRRRVVLRSFSAAHPERQSDNNTADGDGYADPPAG